MSVLQAFVEWLMLSFKQNGAEIYQAISLFVTIAGTGIAVIAYLKPRQSATSSGLHQQIRQNSGTQTAGKKTLYVPGVFHRINKAAGHMRSALTPPKEPEFYAGGKLPSLNELYERGSEKDRGKGTIIERMLRAIRQGRSVALVGKPLLGKTWVMLWFEEWFQKRGQTNLGSHFKYIGWITARSGWSIEAFVQKVLESLEIGAPFTAEPMTLENLDRALDRFKWKSKQIAILCIDKLEKLDRNIFDNKFYKDLGEYISPDTPRLVLIVTTQEEEYTRERLKWFKIIDVIGFTWQEANIFIDSKFKGRQLTDAERDLICEAACFKNEYKRSAWSPFRLQLAGEMVKHKQDLSYSRNGRKSNEKMIKYDPKNATYKRLFIQHVLEEECQRQSNPAGGPASTAPVKRRSRRPSSSSNQITSASASSPQVTSAPASSDLALHQDSAVGAAKKGEPDPVQIYIGYAQEDEDLEKELEKHMASLVSRKIINLWNSQLVGAGLEKNKETNDHIDKAQLILLLVSKDFIASNGEQVKRVMQRQGEARVIPILLRHSYMQGTSFDELLCLPRNGKPVDSSPNRDETWRDIVQELGVICEELHGQQTS